MGVTAARVKTEKSKRRPGKSAHVAVNVKPATVHAATIRSIKEVASCYFRPKCMSSTPAVEFSPLPSRLSRLRPPSARRGGADLTVKYWVNMNQWDRAVDSAGMSGAGSNVGLSLFACASVWDEAEAEICITGRKYVGKSVTGNWKLKLVTSNFTGNRFTGNRITTLIVTGVKMIHSPYSLYKWNCHLLSLLLVYTMHEANSRILADLDWRWGQKVATWTCPVSLVRDRLSVKVMTVREADGHWDGLLHRVRHDDRTHWVHHDDWTLR